MKILIADDEKIERDALRYMLQRAYGENLLLCEAKNGAEAVTVFESEHPNAVLLDIQMPVMDGLEVCRKIRQQDSLVPVIIVTAYSLFEYAQEAIRYQVRGYLVKPYSMMALREIMDPVVAEEGIAPLEDDTKEIPARAACQQNELVTAVKAYISEHYREDITLEVLEAKLAKSRFVISRNFNESEKESIREYINRVRISHAISLMKEGKNISEAAYEVGFCEPTHFSKVFRKIVGISPSAYMAENGNVE